MDLHRLRRCGFFFFSRIETSLTIKLMIAIAKFRHAVKRTRFCSITYSPLSFGGGEYHTLTFHYIIVPPSGKGVIVLFSSKWVVSNVILSHHVDYFPEFINHSTKHIFFDLFHLIKMPLPLHQFFIGACFHNRSFFHYDNLIHLLKTCESMTD